MAAAHGLRTTATGQPARLCRAQGPALSCGAAAPLRGLVKQCTMAQRTHAGVGAPNPDASSTSGSSGGGSSQAGCASQAAEAQPAAQGAPSWSGFLAALAVASWPWCFLLLASLPPAARRALLPAVLAVPAVCAWLMGATAWRMLVRSGHEAVKKELSGGKQLLQIMAEQRRLFRSYQERCSSLVTLLIVPVGLWAGLELCSPLLRWVGAEQLLPVVTAAKQLVKAAIAAFLTGLLYSEGFEVLVAQRMRLGAAAERRLVLAARRAAAGSGGKQPSTP